MGVRIGSAPAAMARSSEPRDRASRLPPPGAASTSLEGTYGRELIHRIVAHLLHLLGSFGFIGPVRVAEGLTIMLQDPDAMLGATFAAFDADGDGAIDARDLATVLSLARPFFAVPHSELVKKFQGMLERAGGPRGHRAKHGIERTALDSVMMYTPALEAWTLTPVRATAEWLRVRAVAESGVDARWRRTKNDAQTTAPPPPPRLKPPPRGVSRREELMGVRGLGLNATPAMRSMSKPILIKPTKPERKVLQKPIAAAPKPKLRGPQDEDDDEDEGERRGKGDPEAEDSPGGGKGAWVANWAKQAAEQFLHIDGVKNRVDPLDSDDPYRPDSPSILKPSGSFVAAQVVNMNVNEDDAVTDKSKSGRKPRRRRRSSVTWGDDDDGALVIPGAVIVPDGPVADSSAQHEEEVGLDNLDVVPDTDTQWAGDGWGVRAKGHVQDGDDSSSYRSHAETKTTDKSSDVSSTLGGGSQSVLSVATGLTGMTGTTGATKTGNGESKVAERTNWIVKVPGARVIDMRPPDRRRSLSVKDGPMTSRTETTGSGAQDLTEEELLAIETEKESFIERKMREEIEAKQLAALAGKAHQKDWDYVNKEDRNRRIPRRLVKAPVYKSIEQAGYEAWLEDHETKQRKMALGIGLT